MLDPAQIQLAASLLCASTFAVGFTGAGISTPSGIPDFRSPESGLWEHVDPMAVASILGFRQNPQRFYDWVRPLAEKTLLAQPNPAHTALATLEQRGHLHGIITQNIDMLHTRAGSQVVWELHGHLREATCIHCFKVYDGQTVLQQYLQDGTVPRCPDCRSVLKPNVILFGEQLPYRELQAAQEAARRTDLMLIVGSSLEVAPASDLPVAAHRRGAKLIIINLAPTELDRLADVVIHADAALVLPALLECLEIECGG
ncbi:MAG: NAD-dependent deacylase [Anaerolineae bacterium]|jgi:NAD-dependent deacetylase|nr:NAD-dependent deacylase [Anaerolineae bacterium]